MRILACLLCLAFAAPALADCDGDDLIARMNAPERAALRDAANAHPHAEGILWRAEGDGRVIHVVGTMHIHDPRHAATLERIDPLLAEAANVFLEMGDGDEALLQRRIAENPGLAFITEGPTLPDLLGEDDWARLKAALQERGTPGFLGAKMKPWMAMASLSMSACDLQALHAGKRGLDGMIIDRALEMGKDPEGLEPVETALRLFEDIPFDEQLDALRVSLAQLTDDSDDTSVTVAEAYFREEVQQIWELSEAMALAAPSQPREKIEADMDELHEVLVTRRNRAWMEVLDATAGDTFVAVGALHLPGEDGLLTLLQQRGYTITRLPLIP